MTFRCCLVVLLAAVIAACTPARGTREVHDPEDYPRTVPAERATLEAPRPYGDIVDSGRFPRDISEVSGPAALALLAQARQSMTAGSPEQAVAALERALRIEPRNPFLWQELAGTYLRQDQADLAESTALKSNSLARGNPYVEMDNWHLIALARQARGDEAGAREAEGRVAAARQKLDRR